MAIDGERIVRAGDHGGEMYVIKSGRVRISRQMAGRDVTMSELGPGDFFGEMSLLESLLRDADAVAIGETRSTRGRCSFACAAIRRSRSRCCTG